jgi:hypothetical protein
MLKELSLNRHAREIAVAGTVLLVAGGITKLAIDDSNARTAIAGEVSKTLPRPDRKELANAQRTVVTDIFTLRKSNNPESVNARRVTDAETAFIETVQNKFLDQRRREPIKNLLSRVFPK